MRKTSVVRATAAPLRYLASVPSSSAACRTTVNVRLIEYAQHIRESYWFIPSIMALAAFSLSIVAVRIDSELGNEWLSTIPWLYINEPEGARSMLSTIAGSVISVAGVTFSITIAALSLASSQFGPRLITSFIRDRGNQFVLGTYTATFLYCLLILRTIRSTETDAFVPHLAVLIGIALAVLSVGVLIYFIHHVSQAIRVSHVIHQVSQLLDRRIDSLVSQEGIPAFETDGARRLDVPEDFDERALSIRARNAGYVQGINDERLIELATQHDLLIRVQSRPGDFVVKDGELLRVAAPNRLTPKTADRLTDTFVLGTRRTDSQDVIFLVQQLVEVAARAISPSVNDPFTAINCIDWLTAALVRVATQDIPSAYRYDDAGSLRLVFEPASFKELADAAYDPLREYGRGMVEVTMRLLQSIEAIGRHVLLPAHRDILLQHAHRIYDDALHHLDYESDRKRVEKQNRITMVTLVRNGETDAELNSGSLQRVPHLPEPDAGAGGDGGS